MKHVPVRDDQGTIVDLVEPGGLFVSDDDPAPLPATAADNPASAEQPTARPPRARSRLDEELNGRNVTANYWGLLSIVLALLVGAVAWQRITAPRADAAPSTPSAAVPSAPPAPMALTLGRAIVAYDAPNGGALGALDAGRGYSVVASSDGWQQLQIEGSGLVWVRAWELAGEPPPTATATPAPTATPVPYTPPPAPVQRPAYVPPPAPDWANMPVVGRAESPDGVLICESRISQADAEQCLAERLAQTSTP